MAEAAVTSVRDFRVHAWRALRPRRGEHLGWKHRRGRPRPALQPDALGYFGDPLRRRRIAAGCPICCGRDLAFDRLGWLGLAALVLGGAPTVLLANCGLLFAPAAHAGALFPGVMPLMVAILAAAVLKEALTRQKRVGFALIVTGVIGIVWGTGGTIGTRRTLATCCFSGLRWPGPATRSRCVARVSTAFTPLPSPRSVRCFFTCPLMPSWPGPASSRPRRAP